MAQREVSGRIAAMPYGTPEQLANLRPPWTSETAPRTNGRPPGHTATTEYQKAMSNLGADELRVIADDKRQPQNRRFAAYQLLVIGGDEERVRVNERLAYAEAYIDRTEGKAKQVTEVQHSMGDERPIIIDSAKWDALDTPPDERKALDSEPPASATGDDDKG